MSTKNRIAVVVLFGSLSPFVSVVPSLAATTCNGSLGAVVINDELIVPTGQTCRLNGTEVDSKVIVETGARLFTSGNAVIDGDISVGTDASAELVQTTVDGTIELKDSRQLIVRNSLLDGGLKSTNARTITLSDTSIEGDVETNQRTNLTVRRVNSTSGFKALNINSLLLFDSILSGVSVNGTVTRIEFCGNTLNGNAQLSTNAGVLQVGGAGVSLPCTNSQSSSNTVIGNVELLANTAKAVVVNNSIVGNLSCFGNSSVAGGNNTVQGNKEGQCVAL